MKKQLLFAVAVLGGTFGLMAQNVNVTFQVDMTGQTVDPAGVHIAGNFQSEAGAGGDWIPDATPLIQQGTTDVHAVTVSIPVGMYEFKFLNGNVWSGEESIPAASQINVPEGNSNRYVIVESDTVLPAILFSGNAPAGLEIAKFVLDLSTTSLDPTGPSVAGNFQAAAGFSADWTPGETKLYDLNPADTFEVFTRAVYLPAGTYSFKFLKGNAWGTDESVPSGCAVDNNRQLIVEAGVASMVSTCFASCEPTCIVLPTYSITLNVDMRFNCRFTVGSSDTVDIAGPINGWQGGPDFYLTDGDGDGVYSITLNDVPMGEFKYKARIIKNNSPNWEGGGDKIINLEGDSIVPARCFGADELGTCAPIPNPSDLTFRVDMTDETPAAAIWLIGDFTTPQWQSGKIQLTPLAGFPGVFETTVNDICPGSIQFKFVNGDVTVVANEEFASGTVPDPLPPCVGPSGTGGGNRRFTRTNDQPFVIQYKFDTCDELTIGFNEVVPVIAEMFPNPADQHTFIRFANSNEVYRVEMVDILGKVVSQYNGLRENVTLSRGNLESGIYFVRVSDSKGNTTSTKLTFR